MRRLSQIFLLALLSGSLILVFATQGRPDQGLILTLVSVALILLSLLLEARLPFETAWQRPPAQIAQRGDLASAGLLVILDEALDPLTPFLILWLVPWSEGGLGEGGMDGPFWAQFLAAVLLCELGAWASHWAHHRSASLWAFHALHHAPERLYTLNNLRFHPINHALNHLAMLAPALLLGVDEAAILAYLAVSAPFLLLQHSNIDFDFGALNKIFNTNEVHRWHHSADPQEGLHNMGRALVIWDQVFGTYLPPAHGTRPAVIGLFDASRSAYPSEFRAQLVWPFRAGWRTVRRMGAARCARPCCPR